MKKLLFAAMLTTLLAPRPSSAAQALRVAELAGGALTVGGEPVIAGQALPPGKRARLARGARLVLEAGAWGKVLIKGPAVFTPYAGRGDGLALTAGGALSALHKVYGRTFSVRTPAAVATVRGTTFYVEARGEGSSYVCICDGTIDLRSESGAYHSTLSSRKQHRAVVLRFAHGQGLETEAPMEHHSDQEIRTLGGE